MSSIFDILNTGREGMLAHQIALQITGQNIANLNTEGYSRQRVEFQTSPTGAGVSIDYIRRQRDLFMDVQLTSQNSKLGSASSLAESYTQIEQIFNEINLKGISSSFSDFFKAIQDLTQNPGGVAERESVRSMGNNFAHSFKKTFDQLRSVQKNADTQIKEVVSQINTILNGISQLNKNIVESNQIAYNQNELLDQRQKLINQLAEYIPVNTISNENGAITVLGFGGMTLVDGAYSRKLATRVSDNNTGFVDVFYISASGLEDKITERIKDGKLGGYIKVRDEILPQEMGKLDYLAAKFVNEFNRIHKNGVGLDGVSGRNFFNPLSVYWNFDSENTGGAAISNSNISDTSLLTFHKYELRFSDSSTFDVVDTTTGLNVLSSQTYISGNPISFDGMSITISNDTGSPSTGDIFYIDSFTNTSKNVGLSTEVSSSLNAIAGGYTSEPGDNRNALDLVSLKSSLIFNDGTATFEDFYRSQVTLVGINAQQSLRDQEIQDEVTSQIKLFIDSISGVSLDEETANIIRFQHAYEASAKVVSVVDELMTTIIDMVK